MPKKRRIKKKYWINLALISWHYKKGYVVEFTHPKDFVIPKKHLEMLFFYSLHIKQRRIEPLLKTIKLGDKKYTFFYYGGFVDKPTILVSESNYRDIKPLVQILSILIRRNIEFEEKREFLEEMDLAGVLNKIKDSKLAIALISLALGLYDMLLKNLIDTPVITVGELLEMTATTENPPTRMEIENMVKVLSWCGLASITLDRKTLDIKIRLKKVPIVEVETASKRDLGSIEIIENTDYLHQNARLVEKLSKILLDKQQHRALCDKLRGRVKKMEKVTQDITEVIDFLKEMELYPRTKGKPKIALKTIDLKKKTIVREETIC